SSETLYQANYLWLLYFFLLSMKKVELKYVFITGILFAIAYLNRSQIGLFAPFMVLGYLMNTQAAFGKRVMKMIAFVVIPVAACLPWALTNLKIHDLFITSSNGGTWVFLVGNSNTGYSQFMHTLDINSKEYKEQQTLEIAIPKEMNQPDI